MRRLIIAAITALVATFLFVPSASAGNPHFIGKISVSADGDTLTVSGKEAGLGNETQVHIEVTADAECVNPGGNKPSADNKDSFGAGDDFPVQNGKANFTLTVTASFQPNCSPPMTIEWSNIVVEDTTHGISQSFPGPFPG